MSAIARYFKKKGKQIYGYDRTASPLTKTLEAEGMQIHYDINPDLIPEKLDLVIYTPAIPADHPELLQLQQRSVPVLKRAAVLGLISRNSRTLAVAGTHGKTTTTSMLAWLLDQGNLEPSAFLGGIARNFDSNYRGGTSDWVVVEADEYDRSFLHLHPELAVILSTEPDHLDIYGDHAQMLESGFRAFARQVDRQLVVRQDILEQFQGIGQALRTYGLEKGDYHAKDIVVRDGRFVFDLQTPNGTIRQIALGLPGRHNVENAVAAAALAQLAGVENEVLKAGLESFKGIQRRFERIAEKPGCVYIDDYAHHPTEIRVAVQAARDLFPGKKILGIFQPHLFSRTRDFMPEFAQALDGLDEAWLLPIYPAREKPMEGITSEALLAHMQLKQKRHLDKQEVLEQLKKETPPVILTLGAGDIDQLVEPIKAIVNKI